MAQDLLLVATTGRRGGGWLSNDSTLVLKGVTKRFGGVTAVNKVDLSVQEGECVGIIGPNGAGKSTLFELITGFVRLDGGTVTYRGHDLAHLGPAAIARRGVVRTFQKVRPFADMTCLENAMIGAFSRGRRVSVARSAAQELLAKVGLSDKTNVRAGLLSTGQRKRLEVARCLATGADVLLLDEATGGVDPGARRQMMDVVCGLRTEGKTIILIEHNLEVIAELSHRVVVMHLGEIIANGEPSAVMRDPRVRSAYIGRSVDA